MEVKLRFSADSWVEIFDSNGGRLFANVGTTNSVRTVRGTPPLRVTFGNAPGVSFDVDGKPAELPANVLRNEVAQFTIDRSGRIVRARPQADGG
jgi:cytoskeleton protein RodZ